MNSDEEIGKITNQVVGELKETVGSRITFLAGGITIDELKEDLEKKSYLEIQKEFDLSNKKMLDLLIGFLELIINSEECKKLIIEVLIKQMRDEFMESRGKL